MLDPNAQYTAYELATCRPPYWCYGNTDLYNFAEPCEWVTLDMETWFCKWCRYAHQANEMPRELAAAVPMRYTSPVPRPESLLRRWIAMVAPGSFE
ncbi:hypothetical protein CcaverHIS002_0606470 [Cutaneotrichosporon cavernicola]|uniref:Uncharacterized protein n=1 Tax=Cutaneotrichosporon cavernicola TaxID=279322 RepID=A0AA48L8Z3_9TREE|nr:uncharacterized protein CcaverHIS019_0605930 [Cutaneotrichosporon cavernicola]BEI86360.1 hypothetical protein CcaverHIS002_0606470 [Cutaneotrichosporon cavernicola]BEI94134.1 hypothetical protein CcaverHIS019_0605930 [Cutaneotrichosporon cavernicola]BEJ01913.1 hypothetical protein CcaverHIS631_0605950 [Cutaneotrichosporon cavernicola]